ncbi:5-dehydro-4-deoxy-D-glucuronate isomerase [Marinoscillum sp. MHG1-6]|uniref:5-dehydro-4-deoxy-D-glucuronate isomerase n=1 Tax=Marinoscillum sp. MHG1-6 TaxID=2959627 RepID=UPI0021570A77|nr:5-dehydro-4-deoxy-D-glucuronate isomerase [Marinoscillum sp. MHG1-6]
MSEIRFGTHPNDVKKYTTEELRAQFLMESVMVPGDITCVYSMHDRMITIGVVPTASAIALPAYEEHTKAEYFLERRELGIINVGGEGTVKVDGESFDIANKECLYIGKGNKEVLFTSKDAAKPAEFFINSCPAHKEYPTVKATEGDANRVDLGAKETCNERTILQYIHEGGIQSCQLVMGYTILHPGSIWNTFPAHTHYRRMEVYFYFDMPEDRLVMHFMGDPNETRHIVMRDKQAVISPEWSIHSGAGTGAYSFIWAMAGENKAFTDMDGIDLKTFK